MYSLLISFTPVETSVFWDLNLVQFTQSDAFCVCVYIYIWGVPVGMCETSGVCSLRMLNYTDITQNTYVQSRTVTEIMAREKCGRHKCRNTIRRP